MTEKDNNNEPRSAAQWYDLGCIYRKEGDFGYAVNAFRSAVECADAGLAYAVDDTARLELESVRNKALASIELVQRITGFVNKDLMNP